MGASTLLVFAAKRLQGKVALITGGTSGIGRATAQLFANHGARVVVADIQDKHFPSLSDQTSPNETISFVHCDVTNEAQVKNAVDSVMDKYGKLDIMFSNAGITGDTGPTIMDTDLQGIKSVFDVNVYGAFMCAKYAARAMVPAKSGSIIFTASSVSVVTAFSSHAYKASKHALVGLTKGLCVELGGNGIRVNCISPHGVYTPLVASTMQLSKEKADKLISETGNLNGVILEENDVAESALFLGSDESRYVNGLNLVVDGGYSTTNPALVDAFKKIMSNDTTNYN
ncbi:secoisolariciresinol dehydrogenase-like [Impatiens glandulifera]|uniref:secoisolariciresinol dehydrogenase-like n=1 Tax=Impatiens glandulifera TaxID=253017 RepID=UPI001FB05263|nr:secoisolariciresinol dehydrogenase-like [Impatiens glandulifera]